MYGAPPVCTAQWTDEDFDRFFAGQVKQERIKFISELRKFGYSIPPMAEEVEK